MKADNVIKSISQVVAMLHPGMLQSGRVTPMAVTDFELADA